MPWPGFEPGEWDPQSHVLSKLHHQGKKENKITSNCMNFIVFNDYHTDNVYE